MKRIFTVILFTVVASWGYGQTNDYPTFGNPTIYNYSPLIFLKRSTSEGGFIQGIQTQLSDGTNNWFFGNNYTDYWSVSKGDYQNPKLVVLSNGNTGIGTTAPTEKLEVSGNISWNGSNVGNLRALKIGYSGNSYGGIGYNIDFTNTAATFNRPLNDKSSYLEFYNGGFAFFGTGNATNANNVNVNGGGSNLNLFALITAGGAFGIGTASPSEKLEVNGKIRAREIKVEAANWPDYVFLPSYKVPTLQETEKHIKEKGHLPGIPSAGEVKANGVDLGDMNAKLLQKIEELTLHLIEKNKQIEIINERNKDYEKRLEKLENKK